MAVLYGKRDAARGKSATVAWLAEEVGELARAVRKGSRDEQLHELGDVLAWLASLAGQLDVSLEDAAQRYAAGCPSLRRYAVPVRLRSTSAISTAFSAAPLRRLSPLTKNASPLSTLSSRRTRPT